jgi:hypothetical protein
MVINTCPRTACRGRTTHSALRHWLLSPPPAIQAKVSAVRSLASCKLGIALKQAGCALIHGRGRHYYHGSPDLTLLTGMTYIRCQSCGYTKAV